MLVLMAAEACGGSHRAAMPAACAVEMIHAYSLIHDDLPAMDDDDLRRGRPTCHKVFGEAMAILAGDGSVEPWPSGAGRRHSSPGRGGRLLRGPGRGGRPLPVGGRPGRRHGPARTAAEPSDREHLESIHARKTGAMIRVSLRLGGMTAGAAAEHWQALDEYGRRLGLAFQITDDLLDVRSTEEDMGKRVGKDAEQGKITFPGLLGVDESAAYAAQLIAEACAAVAPLGPQAEGLDALARLCFGEKSLMDKILSTIGSPHDLQALSLQELTQLAAEIREALCGLASRRTAHFASNLGVVELALALHTTFDFSRDRLIWDTGHQIYPHKLITGRYKDFPTMRVRGGLMGYPNPAESDYDLFMTGHAGCSVATALGMRCGDDLLRPDENRHSWPSSATGPSAPASSWRPSTTPAA